MEQAEYVETRVPVREKKKLDLKGKLVLAPLTTVGNLPFRCICKQFGADVTISEMSMVQNLLKGQKSEWALLRRHPMEDFFGIQIAAPNMSMVATLADAFETMETQFDFLDLNCGCPIDVVCRRGMGSELLDRQVKLEGLVRTMNHCFDVPTTVKIRIGRNENKPTAHTLMPKLERWGASAITLHGRSRQQRYTKLANWEYIEDCARTVSVPVIGNGDILSWEDYQAHIREDSPLTTVMIARGALIKPWLFQEIKQQKVWDISASERMDILQDFTKMGLQHWGADERGVSTTRRFLLEWLSFLYRYIPAGLLEVLPQGINDRPPPYFGRNELETLFASPLADDWIKISEMLLGPVPHDFHFQPKHRSNSYST